jgi:hypothetical protein
MPIERSQFVGHGEKISEQHQEKTGREGKFMKHARRDGMNMESKRLEEARENKIPWRKWGPYLSERQWGTVREDYSDSGNAWDYFPHEQARSRAYRRGEDGLAGFSDGEQFLCFALALWNGKDPILKERLFGLTNGEGNHGEDVKEYYYYLDNTPTHSYMRYLYKYPQAAYPYYDLVHTNRARGRNAMEYELIDTGIFSEDRYFDVFVEYAKAAAEDILIKVTVVNRGNEPAALHVLPTLWFRNTWSSKQGAPKPKINAAATRSGGPVAIAESETLGSRYLYCDGTPELLFTENETNKKRLFNGNNASPFVKDGINDYIVNGAHGAVNPALTGTKAAAHYLLKLKPHEEAVIRLRLRDTAIAAAGKPFGSEFDEVFGERKREADDFYGSILPSNGTPDEKLVMRQALAGMLWTKQLYHFNVHNWLTERAIDPLAVPRGFVRNRDWFHMLNDHIISMPDKWEYPWYAAWDLAFHCLPLSMVDVDFAKDQLDVMLGGLYMHPNGQIPAYEWNFGDVNPPVHAWSAIYLYRMEQAQRGKGDIAFLERLFAKLMMNFTWWVNRKDRSGRNVFEGGFLGLDNIGVFDRSAPLPGGGYLEQADGTAWMALFCQNMFEIGSELADHNPAYDELSTKFFEHFIWIANALNHFGDGCGMWDEEDGFYYDLLRQPNAPPQRLKVRSLVGLLPIAATTVIEPSQRDHMPHMMAQLAQRLASMPELMKGIHPTGPGHRGYGDRGILALVDPEHLRRILSRMLDEAEFLSPYGLRSISRYHLEHPYHINLAGSDYVVSYLPAESDSGMFGGNSNWRGPIWFPMNALLIRALLQYYLFYGDNFKVECPTGSGRQMNLFEVAREITSRLTRIFLRDKNGRRAVFGGVEKFQTDPNFRDYILFYEYFHGDNGAGIGASHQTGWTGLVAKELDILDRLDARKLLEGGRATMFPGAKTEAAHHGALSEMAVQE